MAVIREGTHLFLYREEPLAYLVDNESILQVSWRVTCAASGVSGYPGLAQR